jgi:4-hydroxyproline epimerase
MTGHAADRVGTPVRSFPDRIDVVDSHTEGEPTRVVMAGWPALDGADMGARRDDLRRRYDHLRSAVVCEPRGHAAMVGALLTPPVSRTAVAGVIFFNNVGCLGMCGHGMIGVVRTLQHVGRTGTGLMTIDTAVGTVAAELHEDGAVTIRNVASHVHALDVAVEVDGIGRVTGDIAYGGNWFFIAHVPGLELRPQRLTELLRATSIIRSALAAAGITGADSAEIDHVELTSEPVRAGTDARCFVLCPGGEYDRSPCGTGTAAKMAVLHARGLLEPGRIWTQESVTGGIFEGWLEPGPEGLVPCIRGRAHITGEAVLLFDDSDPFRAGLPHHG